MVRKSVLCGLAALAGGIIMIWATTLPWAAIGLDGVVSEYSGLELYNSDLFSSYAQRFIGLLAVVFGILVVAGEAAAAVSPKKYAFRAAAFVAIVGLIGAIISAVFQMWNLPSDSGGYIAYGAGTAICGGILALLAGIYQLRFCSYGQ